MGRRNAAVALSAGICVIVAGMISATLGYFGDASLTQFAGEAMGASGLLLTVVANLLKSRAG